MLVMACFAQAETGEPQLVVTKGNTVHRISPTAKLLLVTQTGEKHKVKYWRIANDSQLMVKGEIITLSNLYSIEARHDKNMFNRALGAAMMTVGAISAPYVGYETYKIVSDGGLPPAIFLWVIPPVLLFYFGKELFDGKRYEVTQGWKIKVVSE